MNAMHTLVFSHLVASKPGILHEGKMIGNPADAFYHMLIHMQSWMVLVRRRDRALLDVARDEARRLHARARAAD
jgi:hypothetical protein